MLSKHFYRTIVLLLLLVITKAQVAEWHMDEPIWSGATDGVKSGLGTIHGTAMNNATTSSEDPALFGNRGTCGYGTFNGKDQFVNVPYQSSLNSGDFTVMLWLRNGGNVGTYRSPITSRSEIGGNRQGYMIYVAPNNNVQFWTGSGRDWDILSYNTQNAVLGKWVHYTIMFSTSIVNGNIRTGTKKIYMNGGLVAYKTGPYQPNTVGPLTIGAGGGNGGQFHYNGGIDEVAVYGVALHHTAVRTLARQVHQCTDVTAYLPVGEWQMDKTWTGLSNEVTDLSGNGFHGTTKNNTSTSSVSPAIPGGRGTCGYGTFNGINQAVSIPNQLSINSGDFTVALWVRVDGDPGTLRSAFSTTFEESNGYMICADPENRWQFWTGKGTGKVSGFDILTGPAVANGVWTHLAVSFATLSVYSSLRQGIRIGTKKLYINGALVASQSGDYSPNVHTWNVYTVLGAGGTSGDQHHFNGAIDEVAVYRMALSDSAVQSLSRETHLCKLTASPTNSPSISPTMSPTAAPTSLPSYSPTSLPSYSPTKSPTSAPTDSPTSFPTSSPTDSRTNQPVTTPTTSPSLSPTNNPSSQPSGRSCGVLLNCYLIDLGAGTTLARLTAVDTILYTVGSSYSIGCELAGHADSVTSIYGNGEVHVVSTEKPHALYWVEDDVSGVPNPASYLGTPGNKSIQVELLLNGVVCVSYTQLLLASP